MLPKGATSSRRCGAAAMCCASRTRPRTASRPDQGLYGELVSSLLPTGPPPQMAGFLFGPMPVRQIRFPRIETRFAVCRICQNCPQTGEVMKNSRLAAAIALGSASGALIGYSALAGGDKIAFPENFDKGTLYAIVDRYDNK